MKCSRGNKCLENQDDCVLPKSYRVITCWNNYICLIKAKGWKPPYLHWKTTLLLRRILKTLHFNSSSAFIIYQSVSESLFSILHEI